MTACEGVGGRGFAEPSSTVEGVARASIARAGTMMRAFGCQRFNKLRGGDAAVSPGSAISVFGGKVR